MLVPEQFSFKVSFTQIRIPDVRFPITSIRLSVLLIDSTKLFNFTDNNIGTLLILISLFYFIFSLSFSASFGKFLFCLPGHT